MVRLRIAGGGLNDEERQARLDEAKKLHAAAQTAAAADIYRDIIRHAPRDFEALHMLGVVAQQGGNTELALRFIEAALAARPSYAPAWFNRSVILHALGRNPQALQSARMAIDAAPDLADAWDMIGQIARDNGDYAEAERAHAKAIELQPNNARFHGNDAAWRFAAGDLGGAYRAARRATDCDTTYPPLLLGNILRAMGYPANAADCFASAGVLHPALAAEAANSEAMARLQTGDMARGLALWEQRQDLSIGLAAIPLWRGEKIAHLLLYEDQGLGDTLHFMRYVPLLAGRAERITLCVRAPLSRLCMENFSIASVIGEDMPVPQADARCRLSSLPFHFGTRIETIPAAPYIQPPAPRGIARDVSAPRIGLVWAGNKKFRTDYNRSLKFKMLAPLIACGFAHFVSLQKDRPNDPADGIFDAAPLANDFAETAALIVGLDLVIAVDTAIAHLAGAMGKPVWILLPFDADWRWLLGREDSPWYPSARLFRQKRPGDWAEVIPRVADAARRLINGDRDVLRAAPFTGQGLRQNPDALSLPA